MLSVHINLLAFFPIDEVSLQSLIYVWICVRVYAHVLAIQLDLFSSFLQKKCKKYGKKEKHELHAYTNTLTTPNEKIINAMKPYPLN